MIDQSIVQSTNTIAVRGIEEIITKIPGKYIAGGISLGEGRNSCVLNGQFAHAAQGRESVSINAGRADGALTFAANYGTAKGFNSACFGWSTTNGEFSFAGGNSEANGKYSCAFGAATIADSENQFVVGERNIADPEKKYAYIIGNGRFRDPETQVIIRSNAHTVDWDGKGWFANGIKVGGAGQDDEAAQEVALKSEIPSDDYINRLIDAKLSSITNAEEVSY
jgi:hypothetical protein